jgi:hypothetical protein
MAAATELIRTHGSERSQPHQHLNDGRDIASRCYDSSVRLERPRPLSVRSRGDGRTTTPSVGAATDAIPSTGNSADRPYSKENGRWLHPRRVGNPNIVGAQFGTLTASKIEVGAN